MTVNPLVQVYDVIGLGFGPSNIAIAGAFIDNQYRVRIYRSPVFATLVLTISPVIHFNRQAVLHRETQRIQMASSNAPTWCSDADQASDCLIFHFPNIIF